MDAVPLDSQATAVNPMLPFAVPIVDISPYVGQGDAAARRSVARQMDHACRAHGFVQIRGHGVPDGILSALAGAMDSYFALTQECKQRDRAPPQINRGYAPPYSEALSLSLGVESTAPLKDYFEAFNIGTSAAAYPHLELPADIYAANHWPETTAGFDGDPFQRAVWAYFEQASRVARTLCRIFADALNVDPALFTEVTDHSIDVLRLNHYALPAGLPATQELPAGMGAHTDYGIVTVLWADPVPGLQVLGGDGAWHDVQPAPGALLVNLGDLTARLTNDRWRSTLHRVQPTVIEGRVPRRRSAAFFHDGNFDAVIETFPSCRGSDDKCYPPIRVADHLRLKLDGSRAGKVNRAAGHEATRLKSARPEG